MSETKTPKRRGLPARCRAERRCVMAMTAKELRDELQARRAADPTEAQRGWYRETSDFFSRLVRERNCWPDVAYDYARLAAHFGRLALGQREEER